LVAWQKAMDLVDDVYTVVRCFPREELFGLGRQMRDAALSIPSNIAEGSGRGSDIEYRRFVRIARASTFELQTQIEVARRQHFITNEQARALDENASEVAKTINGLLRALTSKV
jgi:four helix bundle protein